MTWTMNLSAVVIVMFGSLTCSLSASKPFLSETALDCKVVQGRILCVYKRVGDVPKPRVFINGDKANKSQYVELQLQGVYYNATGLACSGGSDSHDRVYSTGVFLIFPSTLPAAVEVSFTKGRNFIFSDISTPIPSYNTTLIEQGDTARTTSCSARSCNLAKVNQNLIQVSKMLNRVFDLMMCQ